MFFFERLHAGHLVHLVHRDIAEIGEQFDLLQVPELAFYDGFHGFEVRETIRRKRGKYNKKDGRHTSKQRSHRQGA